MQKLAIALWVVVCIVISAVYAASADRSASSTLVNDIEMGQLKQFEKDLAKTKSDAELTEALKKSLVDANSSFLKAILKKKGIAEKVKADSQYIKIAVEEGTLANLKQLVPVYKDLAAIKLENGASILQSAIQFSNVETVKYLLAKEPKLLSMTDDQGEGIVFTMARRAQKDMNDYVLSLKGINVKAKNKKGETAAQVAKAEGFPKLAKRLEEM